MGKGQFEFAHLEHLGAGFLAARGANGDGLLAVAADSLAAIL